MPKIYNLKFEGEVLFTGTENDIFAWVHKNTNYSYHLALMIGYRLEEVKPPDTESAFIGKEMYKAGYLLQMDLSNDVEHEVFYTVFVKALEKLIENTGMDQMTMLKQAQKLLKIINEG